MLTLDTSGILAALNGHDPNHSQALAALQEDGGPFIVPAGIMAEVAHMIAVRLGSQTLDAFLADMEEGAFAFECGEGDLPRIRALVGHYRDFPLGYADAAVVACAERSAGRVLTFDLRHFSVLAGEGTLRLVGLEGN